ncbi:unnamed protein product, partial [Thlaspi arvense]
MEDDNSSSSLNEALLVATMCIIGLQVHVHVRDGSVFSGILYTASLDNGFGIVLKDAQIVKKGKSKVNVASGSVVETLVILSSNIVQMGVSRPSNVTGNNEGEIVGSATKSLPSEPRLCAANKSTKFCIEGKGINHRRQAGAKILKRSEQLPDVHQEDNVDIQSSMDSERVKPIEEDKLMLEPSSNGFHDAAERPSSTDNSSSSTTADETSELCQSLVAASCASVPIQDVNKSKEFKLNPEAKIFSPSYTKRLSPAPAGMSGVGNIAYTPRNTPMIPFPEALYPEVGSDPYIPQASPPSKFVPYGSNLTAGNAVGGFHYLQHMIAPTVIRAQPHRFTSQYQSVQASPMFVNPNPQVMVTRSGQLVYIQPVSQDLVQGTPPLPVPPMLSRPLPTAQHVQYLKHQGVVAAGQPLQLCVSQPLTASGLQPYGVPTQFPVMQPPLPTNQPMPVAVPNERKLPISLKGLDLNTDPGPKNKIHASAYLSSSRVMPKNGLAVVMITEPDSDMFLLVLLLNTGIPALKSGPPSLVSLCLGVVGRHLEEIIPCLADISVIFPADIKLSIAAIAKRRKLLDDDLILSLADTSWEILDVSGSDVSDSGLAKVAEMCKSLRAVDISRCNRITSMGITELVQHCRSLETLRCGNVEGETWEELDITEIGHGGQSLRWLVWPRIDKDSLEMLSMECPRIVVNPKPSLLTYSLHEAPREALPDVALDEPFVKEIDPKTWAVRGLVQNPTSSSLSMTSSELPIAEKFRLAFAERDARLAPKRAKNARQHQRRAEREWMRSSDEAKAMVFASKATRSLHKS